MAGLAAGGRRLTVAGTHLSFVPGPNVGQLRALQRHLDERGGPRLLLGDLNLWWPAVRLLSLPGWRPLVRGGTFRNRPPGSLGPAGPARPRPGRRRRRTPCGLAAAGSSAVPPPTTGRWWSSWSGAEVRRQAPAGPPHPWAAGHPGPLLPPERPGPLIAQHLLATGNGSSLADRWPAPRALLVETGGN